MHELLTAAEMAEADRRTIAGGVPGMTLMEAAGRAVAEGAADLAPEGPVVVVAGPGNNGGDGFVAARRLAAGGREVRVVVLGDPARLRGDARVAFERWPGAVMPAGETLPDAALVVDALFGAGLDRPLEGAAAALVAAINEGPAQVLAVDLPSGIDADSGAVLGSAVRADATVTFFRKKPGHLLYPGRGTLRAADGGGHRDRRRRAGGGRAAGLREPPGALGGRGAAAGAEDHKYRRGHALVVSGRMARTGAARLAAGAALRVGAGLVTLLCPPDALAVNAAHLTAVMLRRLDGAEALAEALAEPRARALAIGPALGTGGPERALVAAALAGAPALVLDADGLTLWEDAPGELFEAIATRHAPTILTPHEGEFARLFPDLAGLPRPARARAAAARAGAFLILKGPDSVIAAPDGRIAINANAPPWLATAGAGDVLAGFACGLLAQGAGGFEAAAAAVWLHGAAGAEAGPGLTAEDLAPSIGPVLRRLWTRALRLLDDHGQPRDLQALPALLAQDLLHVIARDPGMLARQMLGARALAGGDRLDDRPVLELGDIERAAAGDEVVLVRQEGRRRGERQPGDSLELPLDDDAAGKRRELAMEAGVRIRVGVEVDVAQRRSEDRHRARRGSRAWRASRSGSGPRSAASRAAMPSSTPRSSIASTTSAKGRSGPGSRRSRAVEQAFLGQARHRLAHRRARYLRAPRRAGTSSSRVPPAARR